MTSYFQTRLCCRGGTVQDSTKLVAVRPSRLTDVTRGGSAVGTGTSPRCPQGGGKAGGDAGGPLPVWLTLTVTVAALRWWL